VIGHRHFAQRAVIRESSIASPTASRAGCCCGGGGPRGGKAAGQIAAAINGFNGCRTRPGAAPADDHRRPRRGSSKILMAFNEEIVVARPAAR